MPSNKYFCSQCGQNHPPDISCEDAEQIDADKALHEHIQTMNCLYWEVNHAIDLDADYLRGSYPTPQIEDYDRKGDR